MISSSSSSSSSSSELLASNEDLITQVFIRLPVKCLIRFKSVCKYWYSIISDPQFSRRHTLQNPTSNVAGVFLHKYPDAFHFLSFDSLSPSPRPTSFDFVNDPSGIKILQSCNGLLLCCSSLREIGVTRTYYLCNPATRQFLTLPSSVSVESAEIVFGVNLAFDPRKSCHYKVIYVRSTAMSTHHYQIQIYSSETGALRISGSPFIAPHDMVFSNGLYWNGGIHWITPTRNALCFDVDNECLRKMPTLPFFQGWSRRRFRYFGESGGHLHLIEVYGSQTAQFTIFGLEMDYSRWFVKYQVDLTAMINGSPEIVRNYLDPCDSNYYAFFVLSLIEGKEESCMLLHIPGKIISYNVKDKTYKKVSDLVSCSNGSRKSCLEFGCLDAYQYTETLAPV